MTPDNEQLIRESCGIKRREVSAYALEIGALVPIARTVEMTAALVQVSNLLTMASLNLRELAEGHTITKWTSPTVITSPHIKRT